MPTPSSATLDEALAARIVAASNEPRKCVRKTEDTGVPVEFFDSAEQGPAAYKRFTKQRAHSKERGIGWQMTFAEWWAVWRASGRWPERGCSHGDAAVMARYGDIGPYSFANVRILTCRENFAESRAVRAELPRVPRKKPHRPPVIPGRARGWTFMAKNKNKPYMVKVAGKYVGMFATQEEAEAAYQEAAAVYVEAAWPVAEIGLGRRASLAKKVCERIGYVYLKDVAAGLTNSEIAKKYNKAARSSIRMALLNAGLPTSRAEFLRRRDEFCGLAAAPSAAPSPDSPSTEASPAAALRHALGFEIHPGVNGAHSFSPRHVLPSSSGAGLREPTG